MKCFVVLLFLFTSMTCLAEKKVVLSITLTPAGSFQAVSQKPKGNLIKKNGTFRSDKISVRIKSFKTGIDLRDEHFWKHLNFKKHSKAILTNLKGQNGKATGTLEVNGVKKPVAITYVEKANEVDAKFKVKASDFNLPKVEYLGVGVSNDILVNATIPFKKK